MLKTLGPAAYKKKIAVPNSLNNQRGRRAEDIASWYFRLNGFLTIPGFIVHPDLMRRNPRTEADLLGVRFPLSRERIAMRRMEDDSLLTRIDETGRRIVFILVEAKTDLCNINEPWSRPQDENMQRVIRRLGFADEALVEGIALQMYDLARWEDNEYVLQYVCVGARKNEGLQLQFPQLRQIDWAELARFFWSRFGQFPEKLPDGRPVHAQWPDFGRKYGTWFITEFLTYEQDQRDGQSLSASALTRYIETGECRERLTPPSL